MSGATQVLHPTNPTGIFSYVGPPAPTIKPERSHYPHELNETPSEKNETVSRLVQSLVGEHIPQQTKVVSDWGIEELKNTYALLERNKAEIAVCAQKRVASVFQQLVLASSSRLHFEEGSVADQGEKEGFQEFTTPDRKKTFTLKMNAAHTSMVPCLYAYDLKEWGNYIASRSSPALLPKPQGYVFMQGSDGYRFWNSTLGMTQFFNTSIDKKIDNKFRDVVINLLNRASKGEITPEAGLKEFVNQIVEFLSKPQIVKGTNPQATMKGFQLYLEELLVIQCTIHNNPQAFDRYLNLQVDPYDQHPEIRRTIFSLRYKAIQKNFSHQANLTQKIEQVWKLVERPARIDQKDFRELLAEKMSSEADQNRIRKFFNTPHQYAFRDLQARTERRNALITRLSAVPITGHSSALGCIEQLAKDVSAMMAKMRQEEISDRAYIMRTIRDMRGISRSRFSTMIQRSNTNCPSSESTIKRSEYGERDISDKEAKLFAELLRVDPSLFKPLFFSA